MKRLYRNKIGLTLVELQLSALLLGVVTLAVFALYNSSRVLYFAANDKIIISNELQYAADHIYKHVMQAIGDGTSVPIEILEASTLYININSNDPLTQDNYGDVVTYTYSKSGESLMFNNGVSSESLVPKVSVTNVNFTLDGNVLTFSLTGSYRNQTLTFYAACYPRLTSFLIL